MIEDRRRESSIPPKDSDDPDPGRGRSGGSFVIFLLVAIALILAIGFFYLTKDRDAYPADVSDAPNSAARVVGDAAKNAADMLSNRN